MIRSFAGDLKAQKPSLIILNNYHMNAKQKCAGKLINNQIESWLEQLIYQFWSKFTNNKIATS